MSTKLLEEAPAAEASVRADRRRPGRPASVNPKLLPLLRAEERACLPPLVETHERRLDAGQALALATGIGALLWGMLITAGWALFGV